MLAVRLKCRLAGHLPDACYRQSAMRKLYREAIGTMEDAFKRLEDQVPKPVVTPLDGLEALRYEEKTIEQAMVLKLARYISGLNAIDLLLLGGFVQEQAVIQRTLDEIGEDITFLALATAKGPVKLHRRYLKAFWQEEFEEGVAPIDNTKGRYSPSRREIREWTERSLGAAPDSPGAKAGTVISQTYSGYVHAASPHIMEMCDGPELRFYVRGLRGTSRMDDHAADAWNYIYRGLLATTGVANALQDAPLVKSLYEAIGRYESASGSSYMDDVRKDLETSERG